MRTWTAAKIAVAAALLVVLLAACGTLADGPRVRLPARRPSALAVVGGNLRAVRPQVTALVQRSARSGEHVVLVDAGETVDPSVSPAAPSMPAPQPPKKLGGDPTQFQVDQHVSQEKAYRGRLSADRQVLARLLAARLRAWAAAVSSPLPRLALAPRPAASCDVRADLAGAVGYFSSLQQAGVALGSRRVIVLFWPSGCPSSVVPLSAESLSGTTVVLAGFPGDQRQQAEWQADLLQAGASRAIVLVPGASAELSPVVTQALSGRAGPLPTVVRFGLDSARLSAAARAALLILAQQLRTTYVTAPATVLGFADPLGSYARNLSLSMLRAMAVRDFLVSHGVAPSRLFAVGYGPGLPAAPSAADGSQPLDRRVVIVIDPAG
ncbi:MAG TPA: OmpA family protein [Streptosporangiaceae bacterium]|nr:OmpA family protein [Streptosporangiaceae bacterium]